MKKIKHWKVNKSLFGHKVNFKCPNCAAGLVSKLEEAGSIDQCPDCGAHFECPGKDYLAALKRDKEHDAKERQEEKKRAAKAKSERKAERLAENERIRAEKERQEADFNRMALEKPDLPPHMKDVMGGFAKQGSHLALDDIRESIAELAYYREHFLKH